MEHKLIGIFGNMGSGKTTLAENLTENPKFQASKEKFDENSFLPLYFKDMRRWALASQLNFLVKKTQQLHTIEHQLTDHHVVQDMPLLLDFAFARTTFKLGNMTKDEWELYNETFALLTKKMKQPDILIFLTVTDKVAMERMMKRNRSFEAEVPLSYLTALGETIEEVASEYHGKVLRIDANEINLATNPEDIARVNEMILTEVNGKKPHKGKKKK